MEQIWISCEASQEEKNKYCILMRIYGNEKNGTDEPICMAAVENRLVDKWRKKVGRIERIALKHKHCHM